MAENIPISWNRRTNFRRNNGSSISLGYKDSDVKIVNTDTVYLEQGIDIYKEEYNIIDFSKEEVNIIKNIWNNFEKYVKIN